MIGAILDAMKTNWPLLAGLRFVLAMIVVACHMTIIVADNAVVNAASKFSGLAAVAGFLMISGYSISHSIHREPRGYMSRRIDRIWPAYIASVVFSAVVLVAAGGYVIWPGGLIEPPSTSDFIANALLLPLLFTGKSLAVNAVVWTLAIEELLYLCAPLLMRAPRRAVWGAIAASWLFCAITPRFGAGYYSFAIGIWGVAALSWLWLLGWQLQTGNSERTRTAVVVLSCAGISLSPWGNLLAVVTVGATVAVLIHGSEIRISERSAASLQWAGNVSYPLYLLHYPTMLALWHFTQSVNPLLYVAGVLAASIVVHHGVELPFRRYRKWQQIQQRQGATPELVQCTS